MERFSTLLKIRELQIKTSKIPFLPITCRKIPQFDDTVCCQGCEETDIHVFRVEMESGIISTQ